MFLRIIHVHKKKIRQRILKLLWGYTGQLPLPRSQKEDSPENTETWIVQISSATKTTVHKKKIRQRILKRKSIDRRSRSASSSQKEDSPENTETRRRVSAITWTNGSQKEDSPENTETNL